MVDGSTKLSGMSARTKLEIELQFLFMSEQVYLRCNLACFLDAQYGLAGKLTVLITRCCRKSQLS